MYINQHSSMNINSQIITVGSNDMPDLGDYQFYLIQQGSATITYPDSDQKYVLQKNDVIAMDPITPFRCSSLSKCILTSVRIDPLFIESLIPYGYSLHCNSVLYADINYIHISDILRRICSDFFSNADSYKLLSLVYELADELKHNFIFPNSNSDSDHENHVQSRIDQIMNALSTHYSQALTLNQLAEDMFLTPQYLSRFIKKHLNTNFTSLLSNIRLEHAYNELLHTSDSITNIALNNGFPNIAAFHKAFRTKYDTSPNSYRQQNKITVDETSAIDKRVLSEITQSRLNHTFMSIPIDSLTSSSYKMPWRDTINIGMLSNALTNSFHENFLLYRRSIPVQYVRFCGLFTDDILPYDYETKEYNFSNLDVIFDFFYRNDVIPFFELKPELTVAYHNAPTDSGTSQDLDNFSARDDYHILSKVLAHCLRNYGSAYLAKWRFELWWKVNPVLEPLETPLEFAYRYNKYTQIIRKFIPKCMIGGPCFNICGNFNDFNDFITDLSKENISFDFISLSAFSYELQSQYKKEDLTTIGILSPDENHILNTFAMYHHYIRVSCFSKVPVFITEFGSTLSLQNHIYESVFQAAFLCKHMLSLNLHCSCIAYSYFMDTYVPANSDQKQSSNAYLGLASTRGIPRPALHAYHFLSMLGNTLIAQGNNYIVTSRSKTRYQLLCFHYTHFDPNYCFNSWEKVNLENTYDIFAEEAPYQMHFTCDCLPLGRYKVTQLSLNRGYGSALDKYLRILDKGNITSTELLSTILTLREDELDYYKRTSIPRQDIFFYTNDGTIELDCTLNSHEIIFYEMQKVL